MEKQFIQWLKGRCSSPQHPVVLGIGDDAGLIHHERPIVVATDTIADGVHFDLRQHSLSEIGHKAIAVNLSDIAAMGAAPFAATINFMCPRSFSLKETKQLYCGMEATAQKYNTTIFGGDTNRWDGQLVITVTAFGKSMGDDDREFWKMNAARPNDVILVSGSLGGSRLKKHIQFEPRVELACYLAGRFWISACTDITDSLALDLAEMSNSSNVGFSIESLALPISEDAKQLAETTGKNALTHALYDGEDFELILSTDEQTAAKILADQKLPIPIVRIGQFDNTKKFRIIHPDSKIQDLEIRGYEH